MVNLITWSRLLQSSPTAQHPRRHSSVYYAEKGVQAYRQRRRSVASLYFSTLETRFLRELPLVGKIALDAGTGIGEKALLLSINCHSVIAGDISPVMLAGARAECRSASNIALGCFDAGDLPFPARTFDLVTSYGLLESTRDLMPFTLEFGRVLVPAGYLVFTCPNSAAWRKASARYVHKERHDGWEVSRILRNSGFEVRRHRTIFFLPELCLRRPLKTHHPTLLDRSFVRALIRIETMLSESSRWSERGRTHLFVAQRRLEAAPTAEFLERQKEQRWLH